ncbi:leucine-rich repeat-containing protein 15-like isoform X1 [Ostrea edulis]|uniref:leucine-rich repeat-containing protein 15-like isoform X1 n=1 Tax=Ostrea edulis TaxID=37623 RepID=UPI0024AF6129|nr:leucine-rich repeat-containing protein 15-like isoform X1 [Ostrea edulis]
MLSVLYSQGTVACPDKCRCSRSPICNGTYVDCSLGSLSGVPTNIPTDTCKLNLEYNQITTLRNGILDNLANLQHLNLRRNKLTTIPELIFETLVNLQFLDLRWNQITTIPDGIFETLVNLQHLYLWDNLISTLPNGMFDGLTNIHTLNMGGNKITTLPNGIFDTLVKLRELSLGANQIATLPNGIFDALLNLKTINLYSNEIRKLPNGIFDALVNLQDLYIYRNQIATIPIRILHLLVNLQTFALERNPLRCDCQLVSFLRFAESRKLFREPSCQSPLHLNGTLLKAKRLHDMVCDSDSTTGSDLSTTRAIIDIPGKEPNTTATDVITTHPEITTTKITKVFNEVTIPDQCSFIYAAHEFRSTFHGRKAFINLHSFVLLQRQM